MSNSEVNTDNYDERESNNGSGTDPDDEQSLQTIQDCEIEQIFDRIQRAFDGLPITIDGEPINDRENGGFTAAFKPPAITGEIPDDICVGVFASLDRDPKITLALHPEDTAHLARNQDPNSDHVILEFNSPTSNLVHRIVCRKVISTDETPLLYFETRLSEFYLEQTNMCVDLILALFRLPSA